MLLTARTDVLSGVLLLIAGVAAAAVSSLFGLRWEATVSGDVPWRVIGGLGALFCLDGTLHSLLWMVFGRRYLARFGELADYFAEQRGLELAAGGIAAPVGEELVFRGVLMRGLVLWARLPALWAVLLSAAIAGIAYRHRDPDLGPFAVWAALQALVLGGLFAATGSLITVAVVHALHDLVLFALFARVRANAWPPR